MWDSQVRIHPMKQCPMWLWMGKSMFFLVHFGLIGLKHYLKWLIGHVPFRGGAHKNPTFSSGGWSRKLLLMLSKTRHSLTHSLTHCACQVHVETPCDLQHMHKITKSSTWVLNAAQPSTLVIFCCCCCCCCDWSVQAGLWAFSSVLASERQSMQAWFN